MKWHQWTAASSMLLIVLLDVGAVSAQYLRSDDEEAPVSALQTYPTDWFLMDQPTKFNNYAFDAFQNYEDNVFPYTTSRRTFYGPLGDSLLVGYDVAWWSEQRSSTLGGDSELYKHKTRFRNIFNEVVITGDATENWSGKAILGAEILTMFTPLTFYWAGLNGLRGDWMTSQTRVSVIGSRVSHPIYPRNWGTGYDLDGLFRDQNPVFMLGGHAERSIGILNLGGTYVNIHSSNLESSGESLRGEFPTTRNTPVWIAVKVADDSPEDGRGGPQVFDVVVWVNGELRDDVQPDVVRYHTLETGVGRTSSITGEFTKSGYASISGLGIFQVIDQPVEIPLFADYMYLLDHLDGEDVSRQASIDRLTSGLELLPGVACRADGDDYLVYYFDVSGIEDLDSVELGFLMGNDYRLSISEVQRKTQQGRYEQLYRAELFRTIARAPGNVQNLSNVRWVKFRYGWPTGLSVYSVNMRADFHGLRLEGEYAISEEYNQYPRPDLEGGRHTRRGQAWYLVAEKAFERWGGSGEVFSMNPQFTTYLMTSVPYSEDRKFAQRGFVNDTGLWLLVQDNDDHDRWPDLWLGDIVEGITTLYSTDTDIDGVFPGKDEDQDGLPDTNKNYNDIPDYQEPFLMYDVEPDDYVFGPDLNNNDVPDEREDDYDPEYPYDLDLQGFHLIGWFEPFPHLRATLGRLDARQIAGGRENRMTYGGLSYNVAGSALGEVRVECEIKRVHDDIPDETVRGTERTSRPYAGSGYYHVQFGAQSVSDELSYRNSLASRSCLVGRLTVFRNLEVFNRLKLEINEQRETLFDDRTFQPWDRLRVLAGVHKTGYAWVMGRLSIFPQFKMLYLKKERRSLGIPLIHERHSIPILKAKYQLTEKTSVKAGMQGLPLSGLEYRYKDFTDSSNSFSRQNRVLLVANQSEHLGYSIVMNAGLMYDRIEYLDARQQQRNASMTSMFLRILLGY